MATDDHDLDDFDLDDGLDIPDFDDSMLDGTPNRDRKPIEKITGGFFDGVKSAAINSSTQKKMIETALPKGYGKAAEDISAGIEIGQDLYNTAKDQLRPVQRDMKRIGRFISQKSGKFLPEGVKKKLDELSTEDDNARLSEANLKDQEINAGLESIFGASLELESKRAEEEQSDRLKNEVLGKSRFDTQAKILDSMRSGVERLVGYQDRVTANYQRKSLELQYRQYFVSKDHYTLFEGHVAQSKSLLEAIAKNSSLPDFVKTRKSETASLMLRERMLSQLGSKLSTATEGFRENLTSKLNSSVKEFAGKLAGGISQASQGIDMAADAPGIDPAELGGSALGSLATEAGLDKLATRLGLFLGKNERIRTLGNNLNYYSDNKEDIFREFLDSEIAKSEESDNSETPSEFDKYGNPVTADYVDEYDDNGNIIRYDSKGKVIKKKWTNFFKNPRANLVRMVKDNLPTRYSAEASFGVDAATLKEEGVPFSALTDKSITEVIPGLLSEILKETEMARTGSDTVEKRIFDFESGTIQRQDEVQVKMVEKVLPKGKLNAIREDLTAIVDDVIGTNDLSDSARAAFTRQLLKDASNNKGFSPTRYFTPNGLDTITDEKVVAEIRQLLATQFLDDDGNFDSKNEKASQLRDQTSEKYRYLKDSIPDYQETIGKLSSVYGFETLQNAGLLSDVEGSGINKVDTGSVLSKILGSEGVPKLSKIEEQMKRIDQLTLEVGPTDDDLNAAEDMISPYAEIPVSVDLKDQFENILKALAKIDPRKHLELNGEWLRKIYELLLGGGGPSGSGPSGGPREPKPSGGRGKFPTQTPRQMAEKARGFGSRLLGKAKDTYDQGLAVVDSRGGLKSILDDMITDSKKGIDRVSSRINDVSDKVKEAYADLDIKGRMERYEEMARSGMSKTQIQIEYYKDKLFEEGIDIRDKAIDSIDDLQEVVDKHYTEAITKGSEVMKSAKGTISSKVGSFKESVLSKKDIVSDKTKGFMSDIENIEISPRFEEMYSGIRTHATAMGESFSERYSDFDGLDTLFGSEEARNDNRYYKALTDVLATLDDKRSDIPDRTAIKSTIATFLTKGKERLSELQKRGEGAMDDVGLLSQSVMEDMAKNISGMLKKGGGNTEVSTYETQENDGYWERAQLLVTQLKDKIDFQTEELQETLSNLTIATMASSSMGGDISNLLKRLRSSVGKGASGIFSFYGNTFKAAGKLGLASAKLKINLTGKAMSGLFGSSEDIYIAGESKPVIKAKDLNNGNVFDEKTNAVIKSLADIKGAVVDRAGNILISEEDVEAKRLYNKQGKQLKLPNVRGVASKLTSYMTSPYKAMFDISKGIFSKGKSFLTAQRDIYVKGESKPKLLASVMKNGGYRSQATGKVIESIKDIDGEVIDLQGNVVLTLDDMKTGLVDSKGKLVRGVFNRIKGMLTGTVNRIGNVYRGGIDFAKKGLSRLTDVVGLGKFKLSEMDFGSFDGLSLITKGNQEQTELLTEIRDIIDSRLDKPVKGDRDGDGYREGGWRDKLYGKKDTVDKDKTPTKPTSRKSSGLGLAGMLSSLFGMGEDSDSGYGGPGIDVDIDRREKDDKRTKRGRGSKKAGFMKRMAGKAGRGMMSLGRGAASIGVRALPILATAAPAIASGIGTAASAVGTGLAALGTGAAAVLSSPVVLTAGAIAAVGGAGYLAYKYFTGGDNGPLHRVRLAQYGANPDNKDHIGYIESLEDDLIDEVQFRKNESPILGSGVDIEDLMDDFDIDLDDPDAVSNWLNWFQNRFKPVFLSHVSVLRNLDPDADLDDVDDDLDDDLKAKYLRKTKFPDGIPYQVMTSPFEDNSPLVGIDVISREFTTAMSELPESDTKDSSVTAPIVAGVVSNASMKRSKSTSISPSNNVAVNTLAATGVAASTTLIRSPEYTEQLTKTQSKKENIRASIDIGENPIDVDVNPVSFYNESIDDEKLEQNRHREAKIAQQTSVQTATMSRHMAHSMDKMTTVLINSHKVQQRMAKSLSNLDDHFKAVREKEEAEENDSILDNVKDGFLNVFGGSDKETEREVKASVNMSK